MLTAALLLALAFEQGSDPWRMSVQRAKRAEVDQSTGLGFWLLLRNLTSTPRVICVDETGWSEASGSAGGGGIGLSPHDACRAFERRNRVLPGESLAIPIVLEADSVLPIKFELEFRDLGPEGTPQGAVSRKVAAEVPKEPL